jgi:succinate dehydrogenase/fumarate reductase flavoprotein subunit
MIPGALIEVEGIQCVCRMRVRYNSSKGLASRLVKSRVVMYHIQKGMGNLWKYFNRAKLKKNHSG